MLKKIKFIGLIQIICAVIASLVSFLVLHANDMLSFGKWLQWEIFWYIMLMIFSNVIFAHRIAQGKVQEVLFFLSTFICVSNLLAFILYALIQSNFNFSRLDWLGFLDKVIVFDFNFYGLALVFFAISSNRSTTSDTVISASQSSPFSKISSIERSSLIIFMPLC